MKQNWRQCGNCDSYLVMEESAYQNMITQLSFVVNDTTYLADFINSLITLWTTNGLAGRPLKTLTAVNNLIKEAERMKASRAPSLVK